MEVKFGGLEPTAVIVVADPRGRIAQWLGIRPGPLRGDEKLRVELAGPEGKVTELAEELREMAGVDEVTVEWK
jgi:hypothetical protein